MHFIKNILLSKEKPIERYRYIKYKIYMVNTFITIQQLGKLKSAWGNVEDC